MANVRIIGSESIYADVPLVSISSQIRVLQIEPSNHNDSAAIIARLMPTDIARDPPYDALSYHWGQDVHREKINVNGCDIEVTPNLVGALRRVRRSTRPVLLWVDSICINQHDVLERNAQVAMMHEIYRNARKTVAWIGDGGEEGERALEFLRWYARRDSLERPEDLNDLNAENEAACWAAVINLMNRPYWRRLWVIQEIALSATFPDIACGGKSIRWCDLQAALRDGPSFYHFTRLNRVRGATRELMKKSPNNRRSRHGRHIIFLLSHSAGFEASEPRDRVYALYGLFKVAGMVDFVPDYSASISDVYQQIIKYVLSLKGGLDILELKSHQQEVGWPSWVIDFAKPPPFSLPTPHRNEPPWQREGDALSESVDRLTLEDDLASRSNDPCLEVSGALVRRVHVVAPVHPCAAAAFRRALEAVDGHGLDRASLRNSNSNALLYWKQKENPGHAHYFCYDVVEYLAKWWPILSELSEQPTEHLNWVLRTHDWTQMLKETPLCHADGSSAAINVVRDVDIDSRMSREAFDTRYADAFKPILYTLSLMMLGRQCFSTREGYLGVGLTGIRKGDKIVACQSTKQLHILREQNAYHEYVGSAILASPGQGGRQQPPSLKSVFMSIKHRKTENEIFKLR